LTLTVLCKKFKIKAGSIKIGLDGQQVLEAVGATWPLKIHQPDYDLLKDI
jgi:hypothetical protein